MRVRSIRWARLVAGTLLLGLVLLTSSCTEDAPQSSLRPAGEQARKIDGLFDIAFWIAVGVFIIVYAVLMYVLFRFRERPAGEAPRQTHGNTRLEVTWTILPALVLAGLAIPTVATIFDLDEKPADALEIKVIGHQWWWEVQYPEQEFETANEIHIPVDRPVRLTLESADVIHSFWVPRLAGKQDLVPGHTNHWTIQADEAGEYMGQCAEYCGLSHANMRFRVIAQEEDEFERWVAAQQKNAAAPSQGLAAEGAKVFQEAGCTGCHAVRGVSDVGNVGPDLTHFADRGTFAGGIFDTTPENIETWLRNPPKEKPGSIMPNLGLSQEQIEALRAYLLFLE